MFDFASNLLLERVEPNLQRVRILAVLPENPPPCHFPAPGGLVRREPVTPFWCGRVVGDRASQTRSRAIQLGADAVALRNRLRHLMKMHQSLVGGGICLGVAGA